MESSPLVSIIVPVYNGERFLQESLDTILRQTYPNVEVLVMDDASTDATPAIIASYGERLQHHRQAQNRGIYGNANDGIARGKGEYIAVYHGDDVYDPRIVEREVDFLRRYPEAGAVFCADVFIDADGQEFGRMVLQAEVRGERPLAYPAVFNALLTYKNRFLVCPTAMVRAAVHEDVGVYRDAEFRNTSDLDMWLRIARKYPIGVLEEQLLRYRRGHGSSSERYHRLRTDPERFFTIMDLYLAEGDRALATPASLAAYEAHRAEDRLMLVVNNYILDRRPEAREMLGQIRASQILASPRIQRVRMLVLFIALWFILHAPRMSAVAKLFQRRWYSNQPLRRPAAGGIR